MEYFKLEHLISMRPLLILLLISFSKILSAQDTADKPFICPQLEYPGGDSALVEFLQKNLKYPDMARELDIQGKVVVSFVVNQDGFVSDVSVKKGVSKELDDEAVRVTKLLHFLPFKRQSDTFKNYWILPIKFSLPSDSAIHSKTH